MAERRVPPKRRARTTGEKAEPLDFKARLARAKTLEQATDDGYLEVERDDRLDYCDLPMILVKWEAKDGTRTYNDKAHCRVWALVQVPDRPEPVGVKFRDMNGTMGDQLLEFERCRTHGDVAVMLTAREFTFNGGLDVGYEYSFTDLSLPTEEPPDETDAPPEDPPY